jgi:SAM-dependent methyltransferase
MLLRGERLTLTDFYGTGERILDQLELLLPAPAQDSPFAERQAHRRALREAAFRLLAPIENHTVALYDARSSGFLPELYPELSHFFLPLPQVQELAGAWARYQEGLFLAVLGHRVHPFYGTYVPTRVLHLELFGTWLSQYKGPRATAIDVGTGCGVLALMLCRAGFKRVLATDSNPNAIVSVARDLTRLSSEPPISLRCVDLIGDPPFQTELIVFNPPWIRGPVEGLIDAALYFNDNLFERFFEQASRTLTPDGRVVMVFSNVIELVQPNEPHPIELELTRGRFRLVQKLHRRVQPSPTDPGPRRRTREKVEIWELALQPAG